ncbi:hypothetical protein DFH08DRAFT_453922 [Mycena albidolilacea]|uniref:Uncharacterized protein n=1 Tax=Mycena albidolilacea TaxID=1033008 RepID=A0AAD6Z8G5_9AGAR|nr:hypothetical protein DFH08DRAFT_453922 [Mycena albidolilacea]
MSVALRRFLGLFCSISVEHLATKSLPLQQGLSSKKRTLRSVRFTLCAGPRPFQSSIYSVFRPEKGSFGILFHSIAVGGHIG